MRLSFLAKFKGGNSLGSKSQQLYNLNYKRIKQSNYAEIQNATLVSFFHLFNKKPINISTSLHFFSVEYKDFRYPKQQKNPYILMYCPITILQHSQQIKSYCNDSSFWKKMFHYWKHLSYSKIFPFPL